MNDSQNRSNNGKFLKKTKLFINLLLSIAGYVPKHATKIRTVIMLFSIAFFAYLTAVYPYNFKIALAYYMISVVLYISFITLVLRKDGYRNLFIKKFGEQKGYLTYEGILGFLFFNSGVSISYVASSTSGNLFGFINKEILLAITVLLFVTGFAVKVWAAKAVTINIYYWKDMFLGRKISKFVVTGPYKYLKNPMYGIGQLQAYAIAIFYGSLYGLVAAVLYQGSIFLFHNQVEERFIEETYHKDY